MLRSFFTVAALIDKYKNKNISLLTFNYNKKKYIFIGEDHQSRKNNDIIQIINAFNEPLLIILEAYVGLNDKSISTISNFYNKKLKEEKQKKSNFDDSLIDRFIVSYMHTNKMIFNNNKTLKQLNGKTKNRLITIDKRKPSDYPPIFLNNKKYISKIENARKEMYKLKRKIQNMIDGKIKEKLLYEVNKNINQLEKDYKITDIAPLLENISQIILDFEIINKYILNNNDFDEEYIFGIFGKHHIKNIKKYLN